MYKANINILKLHIKPYRPNRHVYVIPSKSSTMYILLKHM